MKKFILSLSFVTVCSFLFLNSAFSELIFISNFDDGAKEGTYFSDFGSWDKDPNDDSQTCVLAFDPNEIFGDQGMSVSLEYDVDSPNPAYNGFWMKLRDLDLSKYKYMVVYVKGDTNAGFTKSFKVELKGNGMIGRYMVENVTDAWSKFQIPLTQFRGLKDLTKINEFTIVFDDINSNPKTGKIYFDNIYFTD